MREFKKPGRRVLDPTELIKSGALLVLLCVLAFFAVRGALGMYSKFAEAAAARSSAESELTQLQQRYGVVKAQVEELGSSRGIEAAVRERYGYARPGEGEIDIVQQASTTAPKQAPQSFFAKLWRLLFVW